MVNSGFICRLISSDSSGIQRLSADEDANSQAGITLRLSEDVLIRKECRWRSPRAMLYNQVVTFLTRLRVSVCWRFAFALVKLIPQNTAFLISDVACRDV